MGNKPVRWSPFDRETSSPSTGTPSRARSRPRDTDRPRGAADAADKEVNVLSCGCFDWRCGCSSLLSSQRTDKYGAASTYSSSSGMVAKGYLLLLIVIGKLGAATAATAGVEFLTLTAAARRVSHPSKKSTPMRAVSRTGSALRSQMIDMPNRPLMLRFLPRHEVAALHAYVS